MARETLRGPDGIRIVLDSDEIFPDDPGAGTPAMVYGRGKEQYGTFWYACDTGSFSGDNSAISKAGLKWLQELEDQVNAWITNRTPKEA